MFKTSSMLANYERRPIFTVFENILMCSFGESSKSLIKFCLEFWNSLSNLTKYMVVHVNTKKESREISSRDRKALKSVHLFNSVVVELMV